MSSAQVLSNYINKLRHPITEIRERSLKLLLTKLTLGWELEDELSSTRDLIEALVDWFHSSQPSLQREALNLFIQTIKTKGGTYIAKEIGIRNLLIRLDKVKHKITDPKALETFEDLIETLKFLSTVESADNVAIPRLDLPSTNSSESGQNSNYYNIDPNFPTSKETSVSNEEIEIRTENYVYETTECIKVLLFPWVELSASDTKTMLLIEDALKLLKSVRRCCRFIRDVFLQDFPVEIFLNRPAIIKNLLSIAQGDHGNRPGEALQVLLFVTRALRRRLLELTSKDLIHDTNKLPEDHREVEDHLNNELERMTSSVDINVVHQDDGLTALRQLPAAIYVLDTLHGVMSTMARNVASTDVSHRSEILNLKELNTCLDLAESLIDLLLDCVSESFWCVDHSTKTHRDIAHKSCMVMRLLGDLIMKYKQSFLDDPEQFHRRAVWLRLVNCAVSLLSWARQSALPPTALVTALQSAQLDPALPILYPEMSDKIALALQTAKTSVDHEYKSKYRELTKLTASMDDAVCFMKNKNSCRDSKTVFTVIKKSLPALELHMSEAYLSDVADILLKRTKDWNLDDSDWSIARSIALSLMAHNVEWVQAKFFSYMVDMVRFVLVGDDANQSENEKCLTLLCDVGILTEICCHGLSSKTKSVEISASEIMLYLLRGRLVLSEACWWRLLASLLPVLPLLHARAEHDTQLGKAICKSLEMDIAECMGVSAVEAAAGLARLLFIRCVAVQLDAAHALCLLLDDERYLPPKEALRADVLMNALRRVQPQDFNVDQNSSPSKNPQTTGLMQILDVLKQDIVLDQHGTEYVSGGLVRPTLEPSLRRSTLQQLSVMMRQQELHEAFLQADGLRLVVAILRMSLMVDDYLAFPECAISCVSILNSVCFASRHSLAKITDLPTLLIRVILVFPANDSAVLMSAQVLALTVWSGFALQELDENRRRVPALPECVTQRCALPFTATSYWATSPNAGHSAVEWLTSDEAWRSTIRVRWWCAYEGCARVLCGAPPPPAPLALRPADQDRALLRASSPGHAAVTALLALENATSHAQVADALCLLENYAHLMPRSSVTGEQFAALPWQHMRRFLRAPPASIRDAALLTAVMHFILAYMDNVPSKGGTMSWIKSSFIGNDTSVISLLSRDQLLPQQTPQDGVEVTQLHIHIVKVLLRCVKLLEYDDYDSNKLESLLKILLACLSRIDLKNFHALGYLNELMRCIRYVLHSRYCKLSEDTLVQCFKIIAETLSGCASGGGRKGHACRLDAILSLLSLLKQAHQEGIPVQRWCEAWSSEAVQAVVGCSAAQSAQLRAAALAAMAALAHHPQLMPHLMQAIQEESLCAFAARILSNRREANVCRAGAASLLATIAARASPHCDVLESDCLDQLKINNILDICIEILVDFCNEKDYEKSLEPNVPLSILERFTELEVRSHKCGDVHVSPSLTSFRGAPPPSAALVSAVADMMHNVSAFAHAPVQAWNEKGLYRLLFRCASLSNGPKTDIHRVRAASCRALVAATSHRCVRATLASTKDCLHNMLLTLTPLPEDEMDAECISARTQALLLLASLLSERGAADSVWENVLGSRLTSFFCFLLQCLEGDELELQAAALFCLTQLAQSMTQKRHMDKSRDESRLQFFDNLKSTSSSHEVEERNGGGDSARDDCRPEYMAEEFCRVLIRLYRKISLENKKFQCSQDDPWTRVCSSLSSLLSASGRSRAFAVHRGLPSTLLLTLQAVRDHLSVLGKPIETIKNANHHPTLRILYWLLIVINSSMVQCPASKDSFAEAGIAVSLNRLWAWCMMTEQLRRAVVDLLFNFANECPKAWSAMATCVGSRNLITEVCALACREAALASRTHTDNLLLLCTHTLRHCVSHHQCRAIIIKNDVIPSIYKSIVRDRGRGGGNAGVAWAKLCSVIARYPDGAGALLTLRPLLPALPPALRAHLMPALAHAAHHHRTTFLQSPDLLELLSGTLLAGDTAEVVSAARAVWTLAANNHKAKLVLRSAGVAASAQSALQRLQRATDPAARRASELLLYTTSVLRVT
ncbi:rotatin-like [Ostrinia furnacalis]|uniref:rotatin-like n=1 Tax=Ostrinia furnacalis TaxID=93504 RepID=UPI00103FBC8D|nr:rotatin-like [Ostrinia furnacalis]